MPLESLRWTMAERFGWTLDVVDALTLEDVVEFLEVEDGRQAARKSIVKR